MANISLKICGNPHSNSGFQTLVLFNSPESLIIEDKGHGGFSENAYYFSIMIKENHVHYKLIANNVSSYQAKREGALVIAIAIPRGYKLAHEKSPYDVLIKIKDEFVSKCMNMKNGKLEFLGGRIEPNMMDETAKSFELETYNGPYYPMNESGSTACVKLEEMQISQLMIDIQYSVFANYSEILVANKVNSTDYRLLTNLQIPRISEYAIYIDGKLERRVTETTKDLVYNGKKDSKYYNNKTLKFSIEELKAGKYFDGVKFNETQEEVYISLANYSEVRKHKLYLKFTPSNIADKMQKLHDSFELLYKFRKLTINKSDLSFNLYGEEIASTSELSFRILNKTQFLVKKTMLDGDFFTITIEEVAHQPIRIITDEQQIPTRDPDCLEVNLLLQSDNHALDFDKQQEILIDIYDKNDDIKLQSTALSFSSIKKEEWSASLAFPKKWNIVYLLFSCGNVVYKSKPISKKNAKSNNVVELKNSDFDLYTKSFFEKIKPYKLTIILILVMLLSLVIGGYIGYKLYPKVQDALSQYECTDCGEKFDSEEELRVHQQKLNFQCDIADCKEGFHTQKELDEHKKQKKFQCDIADCKEGFHTQKELDEHKKQKKIQCRIQECQQSFHTQKELDEHKKQKNFQCQVQGCQQSFHTKKELNNHIKNKHYFTCDQCDLWFFTQTELDNHKKTIHNIQQKER